MNKLRKEREIYYQWKSGESELEKLTKLINAYDYYDKTKTLEIREGDLIVHKTNESELTKKKSKTEEKKKMGKINKEIEEYKA